MFLIPRRRQRIDDILLGSLPVLSAVRLGHKIGNRCSSTFEIVYVLRHSLQKPRPQPGMCATYSSENSSVHTVNIDSWTFASASRSLRKWESSSSNCCCGCAKTKRSSSSTIGGDGARDGDVERLGGAGGSAGRSGFRDGSEGHSASNCGSPL